MLDGTWPQLGPDGVSQTAGAYTPNDVANRGLADKLGTFRRWLASDNVDLTTRTSTPGWVRTDRRFLIRVLRNDSGGGVARAVLRDRYSRIDNLDGLLRGLDGIRQSGVPVASRRL